MATDIVKKVREFNRFYTSIIGITNNHILQSEYSLTEVRVMFETYNNPGITARQLMKIIRVDEGYLSRLIAKLVKQKILSKKRSKEDNRNYSLELSSSGKKIFLRLDERSSYAVSQLVSHLTKVEQSQLIQLLDGVRTLLTKKIEDEN